MSLLNRKKIVIFGTTRVGKTTLFRQIVKKYSPPQKKNSPIISPLVNYVEASIELENNVYKLIDTPSFKLHSQTEIEKESKRQIEGLLKESDLILWLVEEINDETLLIKKYLKKIFTPQVLVLNKIDLAVGEENSFSWQILRPKIWVAVVALKAINLDKLIRQIITLIPAPKIDTNPQKERLNLLIFGPPNSGKSTLMNYLLKANRSLATTIAGTTREPVISDWNWKKIDWELVDTAGITKEQKLTTSLWKKSDLVWAVIDASRPLTKQIFQIINLGEKHQKPLFIIINKCDLIPDKKMIIAELRTRLKSLNYCPIICLSALKGTGLNPLITSLNKVLKNAKKKLTKKEISETINKMIVANPPSYQKGNKLKIYFAKQEPGILQHFIFFVNNPRWVHFSYQRYIVNYFRKSFGFDYLPIKITWRKSV